MYDTEFPHPETLEKSEDEKAADAASGKALWPDLKSVAELKVAEMTALGLNPGKTSQEGKTTGKNPPEMNAIYETKVSTDFIHREEGGIRTDGYWLKDEEGKPRRGNGVTIGPGVDLGGWNTDTPKANGLDEVEDADILKVIKPALGLTGTDARKYVESNKPRLTHEQAERLGKKVAAYHMGRLIKDYESAPNNKGHVKFKDLPPAAQTVIFSAYYNYGPKFPKEAPKFWGHVTSQNWHKAYLELTDFRDSNPDRRKREANYLYDGVLKGF